MGPGGSGPANNSDKKVDLGGGKKLETQQGGCC